jgi:hypothetical protein
MANFYKKGGRNHSDQPDLFDSTPSYRCEVEEFIEKWNSHIWLPKMQATPAQAKIVRNAMSRPYFKANWRKSFSVLAKSSFVWGKMRPRLNVGWYLEPENFDKLMEGKYIDDKHYEEFFFPNGRGTPEDNKPRTIRNGDDERIL